MENLKSMRDTDSEIISDLKKNIRTFDPDKKIEKEFGGEMTLKELESLSDKENNKFSTLEELMLEIYHYEKDNDNSEQIYKAMKLLYNMRKEILILCQKHNRSNSNEVIQIIDELLNL